MVSFAQQNGTTASQNWQRNCSKWLLLRSKMKRPTLKTDSETVQNGYFCTTECNNRNSKLTAKLFKVVTFAEQNETTAAQN